MTTKAEEAAREYAGMWGDDDSKTMTIFLAGMQRARDLALEYAMPYAYEWDLRGRVKKTRMQIAIEDMDMIFEEGE